jgi:hypothetical protein
MKEVRAVETDPAGKYAVLPEEQVELGPGDELLLLIGKSPGRTRELYGIPLRLTDKTEPEEDEIVLQHGERVFVAQKIPEFI